MKTFAVFVVLVAACVSTSSALQCYQCVFPGDPKCQEGKGLEASNCDESTTAEKALGIKPMCLKSVVDIQGVKQITRSCTRQGGNINACSAFKDHVEFCEVCENDLCNSSTNLIINACTLLMPIATALFMKYF